MSDQPQYTLLEAGAIFLETINVNQARELGIEVQALLTQGVSGKELETQIQQKYSYPEGEKPIAQMGTDAYFKAFKKRIRNELDEI